MAVFNHHFYNQSLRRYIVMFGNMFNDMQVQRLDSTGATVQTIAVPITYAPKEKFLARLAADPNLTRPIAVQLPAMAFEMINMSYDGTRRLNQTQTNVALNTGFTNTLRKQYVPVPWNMNFSLYIFIRNADDGAQLLEQIIPFFGPEWTNKVHLVPSMGISMDVPTVLNDVLTEDAYEGDFITRRALIYTLNFTVKGWFFGPVKSSGSRATVIRKIILDFSAPHGSSNTSISDEEVATAGRSDRVVITPGQYANGSPTANSAVSINYNLISANSNYGIASNTFFFSDGLRYNPVTGSDE